MNAHRKTPTASAGFSLVELMIALVVGLILLAGVLQILLGNREAFDAQRGQARLQENARLVSFVLENSVAHAGFRNEFNVKESRIFPLDDENKFARGAFVGGTANTNNKSDTLRVRFQGEGGVHNCRGTAIGSAGNPEETAFELYVNDDDTLICSVFGSDPDTSDDNDEQPLVENVDRFEVRYGLDTDDEIGVDRYISDLGGADPTEVRSIRVQLLLRSPDDEKLLPVATEQTFQFSDRGPLKTYDDRQGRLMLDRTIALRNALP